MGAHCCKWVCKSCKSRINARHKLADLYAHCPDEQPFLYANTRGRRLVSYLKDRPDQLKLCSDTLAKRAKESEGNAVRFTLGLLKVLTEAFYIYFVPLAYDYVLKLMVQDSFETIRNEAFEVVLQCITIYPGEITTSCEDIMRLLVKQCKANPEAVTELELSLLMQMSEALHEQMLSVPPTFDWTEVAKIAFDRVVKNHALAESFHEELLLQRLAGLLVRKPGGASVFTKFFLTYVRIRNLWSDQVEGLFSRVVLADKKACCEAHLVSDIFAALVLFFDEEATMPQASALLKMMMETLNASIEPVVTLMITEVFPRQELRRMFLNVEATIKHSIGQIIQAWANKSDAQSFGKLFKAALKESISAPINSLILRQLKRFLKDMERSQERAIYAVLAADLVPFAVESLNASSDHRLLQVVHFLCLYSCSYSAIKVSDVTLLYLKIIKILNGLRTEFNSQLLKTLKCSAGIVLALTNSVNVKESLHLAQALKVGVIQTVISEAEDTTAHFALFLFYVFCLRVLVHFDKRSNLNGYCNHLITNSLKV